jgi:hypothetical protein
MDLRIDWSQSSNSLEDTLPLELEITPAELPVTMIAAAGILLILIAAVAIRRRISKKETT